MPYAGSCASSGLFIPKGAHFVVPAISELVEDADSDLPDVLRPHLRDACSEIREPFVFWTRRHRPEAQRRRREAYAKEVKAKYPRAKVTTRPRHPQGR